METIRRGKCTNFGNCPKADRGEIIEINVTEDFVCPESDCGRDLEELPVPKKLPWRKIAIVAGLVALLVGIGFGAYMLFVKGDKTPSDTPQEPTIADPPTVLVATVSLNQSTLSLKVNQSETLTVTAFPDNAANKNVQWSSGDESVVTVTNGVVTAVKAGTAVVTVKSIDGSEKTAECTITVESGDDPTQPQPQRYAFGRYEGSRVNGIPDGQGTMYYTCRVQIAKHGRTTYYAEAGDTFVGTWGNGDIVNGNLYDRSNNQKAAILAGKRPNPYNLSNDKCE